MVVNKRKRVYKKGDYATFILWCAIPTAVKTIYKKRGKEGIAELGFEPNEIFISLVKIYTKQEFCKEFTIGKNTLNQWENRPEFKEDLNKIIEKVNVIQFKKDVDFHFTRATIKNSDAARVKLWKQLNEGWVEKNEQKNTDTLAVNVAGILKAKEELKLKEKSNATNGMGEEPIQPDNSNSE